MTPTSANDLQLLDATARRHLTTLGPRGSVHLSAAIDALTDPLVPPPLFDVDESASADLPAVLRGVRTRLQDAAQHCEDPQQALALAVAARELTNTLAALRTAPSDAGPRTGDGDARPGTARSRGDAAPPKQQDR